MKVSVDILRFAWPYMVASGKACDNAVRILKAGEEDMRCGVYRSAEVETDGIRRCGDVVFGWRADMPQTSLQHVVLQVVAEAAEHYYDCNGERIPQFVMKVPSELYDAVARFGMQRQRSGISLLWTCATSCRIRHRKLPARIGVNLNSG